MANAYKLVNRCDQQLHQNSDDLREQGEQNN